MKKIKPRDMLIMLPLLIFLIALLIGKLILLPIQDQSKFHNTLAQPVIANQTAIVFDVNGVILKFSPTQALMLALKSPHKKLLIKAACHPFLILDIIKLAFSGGVVEQAVLAVGEKYPSLAPLVPLALAMSNCQIPIKPTITLIEKLKKSGFKLFIFSNLGEQSYQILQTKYPALFEQFDGALMTTKNDLYLKKPAPAAFNKFLNQFNLDPKKIIFIDDQPSNVHAARQLKICAITFINAQQCEMLIKQITQSDLSPANQLSPN